MAQVVNTREIAEEYRLTHWSGVMQERAESGLSVKAYCRQLGISTNRYHYWQKKLREAACAQLVGTEESPNTFMQVALSASPSSEPTASQSLTVEIGKSRVIVTESTNRELLARVLQALVELC